MSVKKTKTILLTIATLLSFNALSVNEKSYYLKVNAKDVKIVKNQETPSVPVNNFIKRIQITIVGDREVLMRDTYLYYSDGSQYTPTEFNPNNTGDLESSTVDGTLLLSATTVYPSNTYSPKSIFPNHASWYSTANIGTLNIIFNEPQDIASLKTKNSGSVNLLYSSYAYCAHVSISIFNANDNQIGTTIEVPDGVCDSYTAYFDTFTAY